MTIMRTLKIISGIAISILITSHTFSQEFTQLVRGQVMDSESRQPIPFATVSVQTVHPPIGCATDQDGNFRMEAVPVGRHNFQISCVGYETKVIPEIMITSGKELVLNIGLEEKITRLEEITVKAYTKKDKPLNSMSTLSARTFSVEEAQRYAGGFDDPARLAASFAGVTTGYLDDNGIIVRGNAPKGLLWRLEGIEISNPNHFADLTTFGGGGVSALSSLMLANSDFFTGAFPAEYGNAMSGVFDIKLRNGNNEQHEHALQLGALGLDISSEGPFSKNSRASYLFNYRYSTFGIIKAVLPEETNIPVYQDLCFKINVPTSKAGIFSVWVLGADDDIAFKADMDTTLWVSEEDQEIGGASLKMGALGFNHSFIFGGKTYLKSTYAISGDYTSFEAGQLDFDLNRHDTEYIYNLNYKHTFTTVLNHKFSAKHTNRTGFIATGLNYDNKLQYAPVIGEPMITSVDENGTSFIYHFFSQSKLSFTERLSLNAGVHGQYFDLNEEFIVEPRAGLTYNLSGSQSISLAYGKHSRLDPLNIYFARVTYNNNISQPNRSMKLSKAHHFVLAYDLSLSQNMRLKIEPYVQLLYDIPVIPDSSYSTINMEAEWFFDRELANTGTGSNIGIDLTLERFLNDGYYYLFTASLFDSKYTGGDDVERNTRYNTNYVFNLLFGKEWVLGSSRNKILGVNGRLNILGGQRITPVNRELSYQTAQIVYDHSRVFEEQKPMVHHLNASVVYRINKKKHSSIWSLQVMNILGTEEFYGYNYNYRTETIEKKAVVVIVPSISYKIEF